MMSTPVYQKFKINEKNDRKIFSINDKILLEYYDCCFLMSIRLIV